VIYSHNNWYIKQGQATPWKNIDWLVPLDNIGTPLVNSITSAVSDLFKTKRSLLQKGKLILILLVFVVARIILAAILRPA